MPERIQWSKSSAADRMDSDLPDNAIHLGKIRNIYSVYKTTFRKGREWTFHVLDQNNKILFELNGEYNKDISAFEAESVVASPAIKTIRAIELYLFLIKDLGITVVSGEQQTKGGENIWKYLASVPGITVKRILVDGWGRQHTKDRLSRWRDHYNTKYSESRFIAFKT